MPNHVTNIVSLRGEPEEIRKILEAIQQEEEGPGSIDFNKILPMPPELNIESGSRTTEGLRAYQDFVEIYTLGRGPGEVDLVNIPEEREKPYLEKKQSIDKKTWALGREAFRNLQRFGFSTWYSWCVANWGTKWNAYEFQSRGNPLAFLTAWSAPHPVMQALAERYPQVEIAHDWADEDIGSNCGRRVYRGGRLTEEFIPADGRDAYEFAASVLDADLSDYGLMLNAAHTDYIRVSEEAFSVIELCGQQALYSPVCLTREDIPEGMYLYHLQLAAGRDEELSLGLAPPAEDFGGSVISMHPFAVGPDGRLFFSPNAQPVFRWQKLTMEELMLAENTEDEAESETENETMEEMQL